jgi:preprotein translocase subunit SecG
MGAAFGGSSQTIFGSRGPGTFLSKLTVAAAVIFMLTSLSLAVLSKERSVGSTIPLPKEGSMPPMEMPGAHLPDGQGQAGKTETSLPPTAAPATKQENGPSASAPTSPTTGQGTNPAPTAATPAAPAPAPVPKTNP